MATQTLPNNRYRALRMITIMFTTVQLPFGTFVGFEFGSGHVQTGILALIGQTIVTFTQATLFWKTMDGIK